MDLSIQRTAKYPAMRNAGIVTQIECKIDTLANWCKQNDASIPNAIRQYHIVHVSLSGSFMLMHNVTVHRVAGNDIDFSCRATRDSACNGLFK